MFSLFWQQLGKQNYPTTCLHQLQTIWNFAARQIINVSGTHHIAWVGSLQPQSISAWARGLWPLWTMLYNSPYTLYLGQSEMERHRNVHGLITETNYEDFKRFIMLGTFYQVHRGQMSQICDISPLRCLVLADYIKTTAWIMNNKQIHF